MKAITTKYLPWTNTLPGRYIASAEGVSGLVVSALEAEGDGRDSEEQIHGYVAAKLASNFGWLTASSYLIGGCLRTGEYCFVFSDSFVAPKIHTIEG